MTDSLGRILVVDDEQSVAEVLSEYFSGQGYTVKTASNGVEALSTLLEYRPALVLLDVRMPGLDGVEVLRRIRAADQSVAVIMVTANEDVELARETLKIGAFDYVAKPFDFNYLDQAVTLGLIQSGGGPSAPSGTARALAASGRDSTGQRMESAALVAAREGAAGRADAADESLGELETLLGIADQLGDVTPSARDVINATIAAARTSMSATG
jgi:two-component system response regulator (stage 0 sporulation protein F)